MQDGPGKSAPKPAGLVVGGQGGQEEVFSRTEVESGRIEHQTEAGGTGAEPDGDDRD